MRLTQSKVNSPKRGRVTKALATSCCAALLVLVTTGVLYIRGNASKRNNEQYPGPKGVHIIWPKIPVFYNVYTGPGTGGMKLTQRIVKEQLAYVKYFHHLNVLTIGQKLQDLDVLCENAGITCNHQKHVDVGSEALTLTALYEHCQKHPLDTVGYLHSKGSFHANGRNEKLRRALTRATLSRQCASMPDNATSCSYSVMAVPHMHTPGNMWVSRCSYIKKLMSPDKYRARMDSLKDIYGLKGPDYMVPYGRFAYEHWLHSHPDNIPYDLYDAPGPTHSYRNTPGNDNWPMQLTAPPRHNLEFSIGRDNAYIKSLCTKYPINLWGIHLNTRVAEWNAVYKQIPRTDSWLWKFYTSPSIAWVTTDFEVPWIKATEINAINSRYNINLKAPSKT